jgi:hypothetical protein
MNILTVERFSQSTSRFSWERVRFRDSIMATDRNRFFYLRHVKSRTAKTAKSVLNNLRVLPRVIRAIHNCMIDVKRQKSNVLFKVSVVKTVIFRLFTAGTDSRPIPASSKLPSRLCRLYMCIWQFLMQSLWLYIVGVEKPFDFTVHESSDL